MDPIKQFARFPNAKSAGINFELKINVYKIKTREEEMTKRTGACACGAVRYEVAGDPLLMHNCHCKGCQRLTGSAFKMGSYWPEDSVKIVSGSMTEYSRKADSGRTVTSQFCKICGTTVVTIAEAQPGRIGLAVGTFDDTTWITKPNNIYCTFKQEWHQLPADALKKSDGYNSDD